MTTQHVGHVQRLRRSESFLGLHFDFHAREEDKEVGANINRDVVGGILERVRPDYVQCDCKGHPGVSSYPTKVGFAAPGLVGDILRVWRDVTAERGLPCTSTIRVFTTSRRFSSTRTGLELTSKGKQTDRSHRFTGRTRRSC